MTAYEKAQQVIRDNFSLDGLDNSPVPAFLTTCWRDYPDEWKQINLSEIDSIADAIWQWARDHLISYKNGVTPVPYHHLIGWSDYIRALEIGSVEKIKQAAQQQDEYASALLSYLECAA